jgi:hypothetical protein
MAVTMTVTATASLALLLWSGWWLLLALMPLGVAVLAYHGAVQAALACAETVYVAFDLYRADLLTALRTDPPAQQEAERILNEQWCDLWRQGIPSRPPWSTQPIRRHTEPEIRPRSATLRWSVPSAQVAADLRGDLETEMACQTVPEGIFGAAMSGAVPGPELDTV